MNKEFTIIVSELTRKMYIEAIEKAEKEGNIEKVIDPKEFPSYYHAHEMLNGLEEEFAPLPPIKNSLTFGDRHPENPFYQFVVPQEIPTIGYCFSFSIDIAEYDFLSLFNEILKFVSKDFVDDYIFSVDKKYKIDILVITNDKLDDCFYNKIWNSFGKFFLVRPVFAIKSVTKENLDQKIEDIKSQDAETYSSFDKKSTLSSIGYLITFDQKMISDECNKLFLKIRDFVLDDQIIGYTFSMDAVLSADEYTFHILIITKKDFDVVKTILVYLDMHDGYRAKEITKKTFKSSMNFVKRKNKGELVNLKTYFGNPRKLHGTTK